ncbi:hypothetical protein ABZ815_51090 [Nonomuraea sp. NPDC047529]|uniref:hypothetical protein n=1 Tax=Nonomuraea sp. NPDC047529 TaxID=3155623 RepID=UPI0033CB14E1
MTGIPATTSRTAATAGALSEVEAIGALLERLPEADAAELVALARTCPEFGVQALLPRLQRVLDELRRRLIEVIAQAHRQAVLAEEWIASLEADADAEVGAGADDMEGAA